MFTALLLTTLQSDDGMLCIQQMWTDAKVKQESVSKFEHIFYLKQNIPPP